MSPATRPPCPAREQRAVAPPRNTMSSAQRESRLTWSFYFRLNWQKSMPRIKTAIWRKLLLGMCISAGADAFVFSSPKHEIAGNFHLLQRNGRCTLGRHRSFGLLPPRRVAGIGFAKKSGGSDGDASVSDSMPPPTPAPSSEVFSEQGSVFPGEQTAPPGNPEGGWSGQGLADFLKQFPAIKDRFEEELNEMESSIGYDTPGQGQIVEYDPAFLSGWGWLINLRGSVFSIPFIYWQFLGLLGFALFYAWAAGPNAAVIDVMGLQGVSCAATGLKLRLPILKPQTFALSLVSALLGFLLSLFNSNGLDRWWKTRDALGIVIGRSGDLALMLTIYIKGWDAESERVASWYRQQIVRWMNLAHILVFRQANNLDDLSDLVEDTSYNPPRQWLTREELALFQPPKESDTGINSSLRRRRKFFSQQLEARPRTRQRSPPVVVDPPLVSRYVMVYYWINELVSRAAREGLVDRNRPEALWKMQETISVLRGAAADVFMYLYCKIPYIYVHLMTVLVKVYLLVIAAVGGSAFKVAWLACRPIDMILSIVMIFFINLTYEGLMHIHIRVWNPLGYDRNDFPQKRYLDFLWGISHQFLRPKKRILPGFLNQPEGALLANPPLRANRFRPLPDFGSPPKDAGKEDPKSPASPVPPQAPT